MQTAPLGQVIPQPPQLRASFPLMFAQEPLGHWVVPVGQLVAQALALQTWPDGQALVQLPQWLAVGRHADAPAAQQPGLALTRASLTGLPGAADLAAPAAVLRIRAGVHALRPAARLPGAAADPARSTGPARPLEPPMLPLHAASVRIASVATACNTERFMGNRLSDQPRSSTG